MSTMLPTPPDALIESQSQQADSSAPSLPLAPRPPEPPPRRQLSHRQWWLIGGGALLLVLIVALATRPSGSGTVASKLPGSSQPPATSTSAPEVTATTAPAPTATSAPQAPETYKVGDVVSVGNYTATVNSFKVIKATNSYEQPAAGKQYVVVDITVGNQTGQAQSVSSFDFQFQDSTGQRYTETFIDEVSFFGGSVVNQGKIRGQMVFEVPTAEKSFILQYQPDFLDNSQIAVWALSL